ncbi:MAG: FprA family A-type flavoprotein [Syntrophobacteraceae bacterium]|nr:FprA family A-type flavoprotein [Syntrophobacteraceae bacterium]
MGKGIIIFATRTNQTRKIAELIAEGMRMEGMDVTVSSVSELEKEKTDLQGFDAVLLGAATYHGEMMQPMKTLLFALEKANLEGKVGGSFGAYGWSGEAPGRIYQTMQNVLKMRMVTGPLMLKSASVLGGLKMAQEYGRDIARKVSNDA